MRFRDCKTDKLVLPLGEKPSYGGGYLSIRVLLMTLWMAAAQLAVCARSIEPELEVRLQTHLTSYASPEGTAFRCVVIRSLEENGQVLIPRGSIVYGTVRHEYSVGFGIVHERAGLELNFDTYQPPGGDKVPFKARLASIDNSREQVNAKGRIKGILAAAHPNRLVSGIWDRPSMRLFYHGVFGMTGASNQLMGAMSFLGPEGAAALFGLRWALIRFPEPEIHLAPGTDMKLVLTRPVKASADTPVAMLPETPQELVELLESKPYKITRPNGKFAGDLINVAFLGSRDELLEAFYRSGWSLAEHSSLRTMSHVWGAFNMMQDYPDAPVSKLLYQGALPDLVFEKSLDTVVQRHHVRLWRDGTFAGQDIWLGAATHDTGIGFDRRAFKFTHHIDTQIDSERNKIATDLEFTGCVQPSSPGERQIAAVDRAGTVETDGKLAILPLTACQSYPDPDGVPAPKLPGNAAKRVARRAVLEARNYILRDNAYYWTYQLIKGRKPWL